ncbi:DUF6531 domain-containing protein [Streptomyces europaeiscabiei]|uniref:scabin-related ADP-ribosyltransferase n=1 Tax=Streptomyces europaeiscabiei TaxID=146819 RepID=UPI0029B57208|nr:DUF6531 domain-containing protein [Streptomyces europaeiscabiei]MDX3697725.1 DUF6531 domain-containing protein [Streptomyces europaeiscabiei]
MYGDGPDVTGLGFPSLPDNQTYGTGCLPNAASVTRCQEERGVGVNTATGSFSQASTDLTLNGPTPFGLTRSYSSNNKNSGSLGVGWSASWDTKLIPQSSGLILSAEDGSTYPFASNSEGGFDAPLHSHSSLSRISDGYELKTQSGELISFDADGRVIRRRNLQGQQFTYEYNANALQSITIPSGQKASFDFDGGDRVKSIKLSDGREMAYAYSGDRLSSVTAPGNRKVAYEYENGLLSSVTDERQNRVVLNSYDTSGRVREQVSAALGKTLFSYKQGETDAVMSDGGVWTDIYSGNILLAKYDPFGNKTAFETDFRLNPVAVTDPLGNRFVTSIDKYGRPVSQESPLSRRTWAYNAEGTLRFHYNGNKKYTYYYYDASNRLTKSVDPLKKETTYTYTQAGLLESATDPRSKTTTLAYDAAGNQTSVTYPNHARLTRDFDAAGRLVSVTDQRGNVDGGDAAKFTTTYTYDAAGWLDSTRDARENTTDRDYDLAGNLTSLKNAKGHVTTYTYDAANRLKDTTNAAKYVSSLAYDSMGRISSSTDATGAKTAYAYDKAGRLSSMTTPRGNVPGADPAKYTWTYGYDKAGNQTTVTDPLGNTTRTDYDAEYRPIKVTDPLGHTRTTTYDDESNVLQAKDGLNKATVHTYDDNGQLASVTDPDARTVSYGYDDAGNLTSETSPSGNKTTYAYDDNGRRTDMVEPRGNVTGADPTQYTWHTSYDAAGNVTGVTDPLGHTTTNAYDEANNLVRSTDGNKNAASYSYDELGQLTRVQAPDEGNTVLAYDELGNLKTRTDAKEHVTSYAYDKANRLTKVTDPLLRSTSFDYDPDGNRSLITNARGQKQANTYDARNLLAKTTYSDGTPSVTYTYDNASRPQTIVDGTGTRTLQFDNADRPLSITSPGATNPFKYTYTNSGQVKTRTYPDGYAVSYDYDGDGRVKSETTGGKSTTYGWDEAGNLTSTQLPTTTALTESRTYDRAGRLSSISEGSGVRQITRDPDGRVLADQFKSATTTSLSSRYGYDSVGRLTRVCTDITATASCLDGSGGTTYDYDRVGNLTTAKTGTSATINTYDAADQLTKYVAGSTTTDLTYDADGNRTKDAKGTYVYDAASRVKSATIGADAFTFVYDADGNRTISNKNGSLARTSRWDVNNPLAQIATDTNGSGALLADYNYGPTGIAQAVNRSNGVFYLLHDRQESTRAVHDAAGRENYTYTYTPWGESTGKASVPDGQTSIFGFTGQYKDQYLTGRLALRARSYDPSTSRFTTTDPLPSSPGSANPSPYAYANNDPVNQADPSGQCPLCISAGIGAAFGAVLEGGIYAWQQRNGGFSWGGLAKASGEGAITGGIAGALMPGVGNAAARGLGFTGGRALATSSAVNAGAGAGFAWGVNEIHCRPTDPWDLLIGAAGGGASSLVGPAFNWLKGKSGAGKGTTNPFPGIYPPARSIVSPGTVFRGDSREPSSILRTGFQAQGSNTDLGDYALNNTPSAWVGTSRSAFQASMFPAENGTKTWVYEISNPGTGISVNKTLGYFKRWGNEREIVFPGGIDPSRIKRAVWWEYGKPTTKVVENPGYRP